MSFLPHSRRKLRIPLQQLNHAAKTEQPFIDHQSTYQSKCQQISAKR